MINYDSVISLVYIFFTLGFFANNLIKQYLLLQLDPKNRFIPSWIVWLNILPILNLILPFIFNQAINSSVQAELASRGNNVKFFSFLGTYYPLLLLLTIPQFIRIYDTGTIDNMSETELFYLVLLISSLIFFWSLYLSELSAMMTFLKSGKKGKQLRNLLIIWGLFIVILILVFIFQNYFSSGALGIGQEVN
jgi:hypothetical protein